MRAVLATLLMTITACASAPAVDLGGGDPGTGAEIFAVNCASCHGLDATGTATGPPLVDDVYRPGHHGDGAFLIAVRRGVPQHHWDFGSMPAVPGLSEGDVADIVAFVRELQREAGID